MKLYAHNKLDGPRGYPAPPVTTYMDMFEEMDPSFGFDKVPEGLLHEFGVRRLQIGLPVASEGCAEGLVSD